MRNPDRSEGKVACMVAATLLIVAPLGAFLMSNHYPVLSPEVGILLAACLVAGAVLGIAAGLLGRTAAALMLGAGAALSIDLMYDLGSSKPLLVLIPLFCLGLAWLLRRHIAQVLATVAFVFLATTLVMPRGAAGDPARSNDEAAGVRQAGNNELPVILHLILDEHIGIDGLPKELPETASFARWLTDSYVRLGFRVHTGAYSEYYDTRNSLSNLLNFTSSRDIWSHMVEGTSEPYLLKASAYFQHLSGLGYRLHVYQSDYMDFCRVPGVLYASCFGYSAHSIEPLRRSPVGTVERAQFIFNGFITNSAYLERLRAKYGRLRASVRGWPLPAWGRGTSRVGPLPVLSVLEKLEGDLRAALPGDAYFAHLLIPHYPYVLDESCRVRGSIADWLYNVPAVPQSELIQNTAATRAERYRKYYAQIRCQQALLGRLFNAMKETGIWRDAIIIVHGDHGSRIIRNTPVASNAARLTQADFGDAFSTLFAVRMPGREGAIVRGLRPLQQLLSEVFELPVDSSSPKVYLRAEDGKAYSPHSLALFRPESHSRAQRAVNEVPLSGAMVRSASP
jgi:hypothetical protein